MKYDNKLKMLWKAAADDHSRYTLQNIIINTKDKVAVATDGHILCSVDITDLLSPEDIDFMIPVDALKSAAKLTSKRNAASVSIVVRDERIALIQAGNVVQTFDKEEGNPPTYQAIVPTAEKVQDEYVSIVAFSPQLLHNLADAMETNSSVTLFIKDANSAIFVGNGKDGRFGILMPMRGKQDSVPLPSWVTRDAPVEPVPAAR